MLQMLVRATEVWRDGLFSCFEYEYAFISEVSETACCLRAGIVRPA